MKQKIHDKNRFVIKSFGNATPLTIGGYSFSEFIESQGIKIVDMTPQKKLRKKILKDTEI